MSTGHDPRRFAMDLLERIRDLLVLQTVPDAPDRGLLAEYAPDQLERMRSQAGRMGASELSRAADLLHTGLVEMRDTMSPRLMFELVLARVLLPGASADSASLQVRLERLERQFAAGGALQWPHPFARRRRFGRRLLLLSPLPLLRLRLLRFRWLLPLRHLQLRRPRRGQSPLLPAASPLRPR